MAQTPGANVGVNFGYDSGSDAYKNGFDASLILIDSLLQAFVIRDDLSAEPGSPAVGDTYILPASQTGTNWGSDSGAVQNAIAIYTNIPGQTDDSPWLYRDPRDGWALYNRTGNYWLQFDGTNWIRQGHLKRTIFRLGDQGGDFTPDLTHSNGFLILLAAYDQANDDLIIPTNASVAYPIGTTLKVSNRSGGVVNLDTTGLTFESGAAPATIADDATLDLVKTDTDTWEQIA